MQSTTFDCTWSKQYHTKENLDTWLKKNCSKWCYQLEKGEGGFEHFQARFKLKERTRLGTLIKKSDFPKGHCSVTSKDNKDNFDYVSKDDTRIDGPWKHDDAEKKEIPWDVKEFKLEDWHSKALQYVEEEKNLRWVTIIYDPIGGMGKTTFIRYCCVHEKGRNIPICNDYKDLLRMVMCMPKSNCYFIDMPRAMKKDKLYQFWSAIETLKGGYAYDDRYEFKEEFFNPPNIIVFTNTIPDLTLLSNDRWRILEINEKKELVNYKDPNFTTED